MSLGRKGVFSNETGGGPPTTIDIEINSTPFLSGVSTNQDIPVQNTENTPLGSDDSGTWRIGDIDIDIEDQNGNVLDSQTIVVKDQTVTVTFNIAYARMIPPQVVSSRTGDSAWLKANGYFPSSETQILGLKPLLTDWFTLSSITPNLWGNTNRFTATDGSQTYTTDGIVQDHLTGLEWLFDNTYAGITGLATAGDADSLGADTFANCDSVIRASTFSGGNWRIPTTYDLNTTRLSAGSLLSNTNYYWSYAPFNLNSGYTYWSTDVNPNNTLQQMQANATIGFISNVSATSTTPRLIAVRWI